MVRPSIPATMTMRKIEFGDGIQAVVATDGKKAVYWNSTKTTLYSSDIHGKDRRVVFESSGAIPDVFVSRDLSTAFLFFDRGSLTGSRRYAVVRTDGTGYRELAPRINGNSFQPPPLDVSWSWDNRYVTIYTPGIYLLKMSLADGELIDLLGARRLTGLITARFSPDDRFIAYSESETVYLISAQGGTPRQIAERSTVVDWSRDGRYLLVEELPPAGAVNVSSSSRKMWALPVQNGQVAGERVAVASTLGQLEAHPNGSWIASAGGAVQGSRFLLGTLDSTDRISVWKPVNLNLSDDAPYAHASWSPDGRRVVYDTGRAVRVRELVTDEDREVYRGETRIQNCIWARTQPRIFCGQISNEPEQRFDVLSIALDSGRAEKLGSFDGFFRFLFSVSPDDRFLTTGTGRLRQWEIGTDPLTEKEVPLFQSEDGQWVLRLAESEGRRLIMIRPATGETDNLRLLVQTRMRAVDPQLGRISILFTRDSKWIVYRDKDAKGMEGLYRVAVSGGTPERLGDYPSNGAIGDYDVFSMSPDGRQFLAEVRIPPKPPEFWALENVIPIVPSSAIESRKPR
jgi:hypothetical protein